MASLGARVLDMPALVIGVLFVATFLFIWHYTKQVTTFEPDEIGYSRTAIALSEKPALWTTAFGGSDRLNQLYPLTLAPLYGLFSNTKAYELAHLWNAVLMASTVVPAFLLARAAIGRPRPAYVAAALVAVAPWMTMASVQLTEAIAYPLSVWVVWLMYRGLLNPSWRADLLVFASVVLAAYGRLQLIILGLVYILAVLTHEVGFALTVRDGRREALRVTLSRLRHEHILVTMAAAVAAITGIPLLAGGEIASVFGFYGNTLTGPLIPPGMFDLMRSSATFLVFGAGIVPAALTVGLVGQGLFGPTSRRHHAYAVLTLFVVIGILLQVARINVIFNSSTLQERYVMFVMPIVLVGMVVAVLEVRRPVRTALIGGLVLVPLIATTEFELVPNSFWFLVSPGMTFFFEATAPRLGRVGAFLGDENMSRFLLGAGAAALAIAAAAAVLRWLRPTRALAVLAIGVIAFLAAQSVYSFRRVVHGNDNAAGLGGGSVAGRDWIDQAVPKHTKVGILAEQLGQVSDSRSQWWNSEIWNRTIVVANSLSRPFTTWNPAGPAAVEADGKTINMPGAPNLILTSNRGVPVGLAGKVVATSPAGDMKLVNTGGHPQAAWSIRGITDNGWLESGRPATAIIHRTRGGCRRVKFTLGIPNALREARRVSISGAGVSRQIVLDPRVPDTGPYTVRACGHGTEPIRLRIGIDVPAVTAYPAMTARVSSFQVSAA